MSLARFTTVTVGYADGMTDPGPGHAFSHEPGQPRTGQLRALSWALGVNLGLLVLEALGGLVFYSLACSPTPPT
jgi:hypothetical protein